MRLHQQFSTRLVNDFYKVHWIASFLAMTSFATHWYSVFYGLLRRLAMTMRVAVIARSEVTKQSIDNLSCSRRFVIGVNFDTWIANPREHIAKTDVNRNDCHLSVCLKTRFHRLLAMTVGAYHNS